VGVGVDVGETVSTGKAVFSTTAAGTGTDVGAAQAVRKTINKKMGRIFFIQSPWFFKLESWKVEKSETL
jgi:hypothetical protein